MLDADAVEKKKRVDDICDRCESNTLGMKQAADLLEKIFEDQGLLTPEWWTLRRRASA